MDVTYKIVKGGLKDIPNNDSDYGIYQRLYNKQDEKDAAKKLIDNINLHTDNILEVKKITIYHKPYSIYKHLAIIMSIKEDVLDEYYKTKHNK